MVVSSKVLILGIFTALIASSLCNELPRWNEESLSPFPAGISEDLEIGDYVATLSCTDPDGDRVIYRKVSAEAFIVNTRTGQVYLATKLDREWEDQTSGIPISFSCCDTGPQGGCVEYPTVFSIKDANDNPPEFITVQNEGFTWNIREDARIGTYLVPSLTVEDKDFAQNAKIGQVYFTCQSTDPAVIASLEETNKRTCQKFELETNQIDDPVRMLYNVSFFLKDSLDYEDWPVYTSKLVAVDVGDGTNSLSTTINIQIKVGDAQDRPPNFINPGARATVSEAARVGTTLGAGVTARDGDSGLGAQRPIRFHILKDEMDLFGLTEAQLDTSPGADAGTYFSNWVVRNPLDREQIEGGSYELLVMAVELENGVETDDTATATYSVFITDVNDNPPVFIPDTFNITVIEEPPIKNMSNYVPTTVTGLHITIFDADENSQYKVDIVSQTFREAYSISPVSNVFVARSNIFLQIDDPRVLDYDVPRNRFQTVVLEAVEIGTPERFSSTATVFINVLDVNDNTPEFTQESYVFSVSESVRNFPYKLDTLRATDADSDLNGELRFQLDTGVTKFRIDPVSGELSLLSAVDYERTRQYVFLAYVQDRASNPLSSKAQVTVNILDANDLGPIFQQPRYQTSANETSRAFLNPITIQATDNEGPNVRITYRIVSGQSPNNAFFINPNTGELSLRQFLDYDQTPLDENGNRLGHFTLVVEASDNGQPPQTNEVEVRVNVIDENNHPPQLVETNFQATISELAAPGTEIADIDGSDKDAGTFGKISYRLFTGSSGNFRVDPDTGVVTVAKNNNFDYDQTKAYTFTILATDGGAPQKSATATISVDITDANNKAPKFSKFSYTATVHESTRVGTTVLVTEVTDKDSTASLVYSIDNSTFAATDANGNALLRVNPFLREYFAVGPTGDIFVNRQLDKGIVQEISFRLQVEDVNSDSGPQIHTTQIVLIIEGDPDTTVQFSPTSLEFVNEDAKEGFQITTFIAKDPVNLINDFRLITQSDFIGLDGARLVLKKQIDYERDPQRHVLIVQATADDGQRSATATVTVSILDVNDNDPQFTRSSYFASVRETAVYPEKVISILATDADSNSFGGLEYRISGGLDKEDFFIFTGKSRGAQVIVAKGAQLDYKRHSQYDLTLEVVDNAGSGSNKRSSSVPLTIKVIDENNNVPYFKDEFRSYVVPETAVPGQHVITTIRAFDDDDGDNGRISYSLEPKERLFEIQDNGYNEGIIYVTGNLLGMGGSTLNYNVQARDQGEVPNVGFLKISITILSTEDDDGNPKWNRPDVNYIVFAPEQTPGFVLDDTSFRFDVSPRTGTNITFALSRFSEGAGKFSIDENTGIITILASLDREVKEQYELHVYAQDTVDPDVLRTGRSFIVKLLDENDNNATFYNPRGYPGCGRPLDRPMVVRVMENTPANTSVYKLQACDPDGPGNNAIRYEPYLGNEECRREMANSALRLMENGWIETKQILDYEHKKEYLLCAQVFSLKPAPFQPSGSSVGRRKRFDWGSMEMEKHDDVAFIWIQVVDENDHGPEFPHPTEVAVVQSSPGNGPVHTLNAVDKDGKGYNITLYLIEGSVFYPAEGDKAVVVKEAFELRGNKGAIFPKQPSYQQYVGGRFVLSILAMDSVDNTKTDRQMITIYVHERGEAMKLVLDERPETGLTYAEDLINALDQVDSRYVYKYISASENRMTNGVNLQKTDVCFLTVDTVANEVLNIRQVISLFDEKDYKDVLTKNEYKVENRGKCYPSTSSEEKVKWRDLWWVLVAVAVFMFVCCLICIILIAVLYRNYKRYMETRKTYLVQQ